MKCNGTPECACPECADARGWNDVARYLRELEPYASRAASPFNELVPYLKEPVEGGYVTTRKPNLEALDNRRAPWSVWAGRAKRRYETYFAKNDPRLERAKP